MWNRIKTWWKRPEPEAAPIAALVIPPALLIAQAPEPAPTVNCPKCRKDVSCWRTYADGKIKCVPCASKGVS
jgi:hypothetical protein